jgi:uncharacterized protein (TIGR03435 family)
MLRIPALLFLAVVHFDVASVKPNPTAEPGRQGGLFRENIDTSLGRVTLRNVTLRSCLKWGYNFQDPQIVGPDWLSVERYDIAAKAVGAASEEELRAMLRTLLAERFRLIARMETRTLQVIALTAVHPKLQESAAAGPGSFRAHKRGVLGLGATMAELAALLSDPLRSPVVDATGLTGRYDFALDYSGGDDERSATISAVQQLGLKLERRKVPMQVLMVDRAEKTPIQN